ncbi:MAG: STAS/SEC14 domain-containing protein [Candidatus Magasanikbacteria bacterium]|jgi:hypothetical protein|nr:STAS/SEC14 domain-containing protein [Candidatus Magasanikbacteria bacterium]MBT4315084.1 STAS/SEC14 domain-containing protein [Candidatus Magasanikbacteria bacterium]MBT4546994.1 STAS/SEC14 domain-containing protein [Candidatus Magasanikbacteria bacterium]MBT6818764.1 STAS/SEC14 domain-containing protein [Candidatus Magasanikbacteria bacterium]
MSIKKRVQEKFSVTVLKNGIIKLVEQAKPTENSAIAMREQILKKYKNKNTKFLVDLRFAGIPPSRARKNISNIFLENKPDKVAVLFDHVSLRVMAKFIMSAAGIKNFKFFKTEKEALDWLKK